MTDPGPRGPTARSLVVTLAALAAVGWAALNPVTTLVGVLALAVLVVVAVVGAQAWTKVSMRVCRRSPGPLLATVCRKSSAPVEGSCTETCPTQNWGV